MSEALKETFEETQIILCDTKYQIDIHCEKDLETFCPYYGLLKEGLELVKGICADQLKCPCHTTKDLLEEERTSFKEAYVCKFQDLFVNYHQCKSIHCLCFKKTFCKFNTLITFK